MLNIEKLSHEGRGIAHLDGKVVFVDEALPGETVEAVLTLRRDSFDQARTTRVLTASPDRVEPPCVYAATCGGCSLQHFEAAAQLRFKESVLHEKLLHAASRHDYDKLPALTGPAFAYRRKARLAVRHVRKKNKVLVGFREKYSSFIVDMDSCEILDKRISQLLPDLAELLASLQAFRHIPQLEVAAGDPQQQGNSWALVLRHLQPLPASDLEKLDSFSARHAFDLYLQAAGPDSVFRYRPQGGSERLYYRLPDYDLDLGFHPLDFTQVNAGINEAMIRRALELLELSAGDRVLDLFCGLGNFTLPLARRAGFVCGVEGSTAMVDRGEENARANGIENIAFHSADLSKPMTGAEWLQEGFDKVLLDPPRSGALEILPDVAALAPQRIVYISCNPATLARDTAELEKLGYRLAAAGVMDMFPQTTHVESLALFLPSVKKGKRGA